MWREERDFFGLPEEALIFLDLKERPT